MKNLLFLILFAAVNTGLSAEIPVRILSGTKLIIVEKNKWKAPVIDVTIREVNGNVLVSESIKQSTKYNLKYVPDGDYVMEINDDQKISIQHLTISKGFLFSKDSEIIYKPVIKIYDDKLDCNLMTQGNKAMMTIRNSEGQLAHSERINNQVSVTRRFNLEKLEPGNYYFDVSMSGRVFTKEFEVK